jgi:hypothetical protein
VQQGARGNRLDGLAQAHLVGEQRAAGKREVQHAFALIGIERQQRLIGRILA